MGTATVGGLAGLFVGARTGLEETKFRSTWNQERLGHILSRSLITGACGYIAGPLSPILATAWWLSGASKSDAPDSHE